MGFAFLYTYNVVAHVKHQFTTAHTSTHIYLYTPIHSMNKNTYLPLSNAMVLITLVLRYFVVSRSSITKKNSRQLNNKHNVRFKYMCCLLVK